mgnify:FL=1
MVGSKGSSPVSSTSYRVEKINLEVFSGLRRKTLVHWGHGVPGFILLHLLLYLPHCHILLRLSFLVQVVILLQLLSVSHFLLRLLPLLQYKRLPQRVVRSLWLLEQIDLLSWVEIGAQLVSSDLNLCLASRWRIGVALVVRGFFLCWRLLDEFLVDYACFWVPNVSYWFVLRRAEGLGLRNALDKAARLDLNLRHLLLNCLLCLWLILRSSWLYLDLVSGRILLISGSFGRSWFVQIVCVDVLLWRGLGLFV